MVCEQRSMRSFICFSPGLNAPNFSAIGVVANANDWNTSTLHDFLQACPCALRQVSVACCYARPPTHAARRTAICAAPPRSPPDMPSTSSRINTFRANAAGRPVKLRVVVVHVVMSVCNLAHACCEHFPRVVRLMLKFFIGTKPTSTAFALRLSLAFSSSV